MESPKFPYGERVLVTGAGSGIGKVTAKRFAQLGHQVFAASRTIAEGTQNLETGALHKLRMDVTDENSVRAAMEQIGPVDIVVHCAGMGIAGAGEDTPIEDAAAQMDVNFLGVLRVNQAVLPGMRQRRRGLVIAISSVAGRVPIPFQSHYSASKAALESYMEALRTELKPFGVRTCVLEPGDTKTGFTAARKRCFPKDSPYRQSGERSVKKMERDEQNGKSCACVAETAVRMARRRAPPVRRTIGIKYGFLLFAKRLLPDSFAVWVVAKLYG